MFVFIYIGPPINDQNNELEIGAMHDVFITIHEWKAGNDETDIYAVTDVTKPHLASDAIVIDRFEENFANNPFSDERIFVRSKNTKSYNKIRETYQSSTESYLMDHYRMFFIVSYFLALV